MIEKNNLFRRNGKIVYIKQPEFEELPFIAELWGDKDTMSEIGGVYPFPEHKWQMFYKKMVKPTDGKNFYCLIYTIKDEAVGEVSFHGYDSVTKAARINIKIHYKYRNKGYAKEAIRLFLEYYFLEFGGEAIIDNTIKTESAKKLFGGVGFEVVGKFRNQVTYRITKEKFFDSQPIKHRKIAVLAYDNMSMLDFSVAFEVFNGCNKFTEEKLFEVFSISYNEEIKIENGVTIKVDKMFNEGEKPDIIILPGGKGVQETVKDEYFIKHFLTNYKECDYLLSMENAIEFLSKCRMLDGISVPKIDDADNINKYMLKDVKLTHNNFEDNGKIIISSNAVGNIQGCLNIIKKAAGEKVSKKLSEDLGLR